ncbi:MAG: hypothetical protein ACLSA6_16790 [Holdemania massiliensis]
MKHITELIQKQIVKKHSRALIFYLLLLIITAFLAWVSQSVYIGLFLVVWLAALAVRLIQAVGELGQVKRFTQQLRGPQRLLYRQADTTFFMEDGWLSWFNKQGVQGTYAEITMCSYARVPLRKSEKLYALVSCRSTHRMAERPNSAAEGQGCKNCYEFSENSESSHPFL